MPLEIKLYTSTDELPPLIKQQIIDFLRIHYPEGFMGENQFRNWTTDPNILIPHHMVMVENERLISHTEIVWKDFAHNGIDYKLYGLSGVMTYPEFQHRGYGTQVLEAATDFIRGTSADIAMFHCDHSLKDFYSGAGWIAIETGVTLIGDPENPTVAEELLMMLFLTEKGKEHRIDFETIPFYFEETTW